MIMPEAAMMATWPEIEELVPHFRSYGIEVKWSIIYKDTLIAGVKGCAIYVTWDQIAYMADHGVKMSVMGFAQENLTKREEGDDNGQWT